MTSLFVFFVSFVVQVRLLGSSARQLVLHASAPKLRPVFTPELDTTGIIIACAKCARKNRLAYATLDKPTRCGACQEPLALPPTPIAVTAAKPFSALILASPLPLLVDFWAAGCGPCKMMAPELEAVAARAAGRFLVLKVNTEEIPFLAQLYQIASLPTLIVFYLGAEATRAAGAQPAAALEALVQRGVRAVS